MADGKSKDNNEKSFTPIEKLELNAERPAVDFNSYAEICNYNNDSSRRRGILSPEMYADIIQDDSTGFIESDGVQIPALIDIKHGLAMGYDADKCKKYAEEISDNVKILSVPFHELDESEKEQVTKLLQENGKCAIYFCDHENDESMALGEYLKKHDIEFSEKPLIDTRAAAGDEQAALSLYSCFVENTNEYSGDKPVDLRDIKDYFDKNIGPVISDSGKTATTLNMGDNISDDEADEMWKIFNSRFDFLGENHPLSMQDTKDDFLLPLRSKDSIIAATYNIDEDGSARQLVCFTYFINNVDSLYWLNSKYIEQEFIIDSGKRSGVINIYTPGLVSSAVGASYASLPIGLFTTVCDSAGISDNVLYENTNFSKRYIPRIVDRATSRACKGSLYHKSKIIDEVTYRLWSIS